MAMKQTAEVTEKKTRTRKPKSLKIERKRKPATKKAVRVKLTVKQAKLDRVLRKSRTLVRKALKKAVRGMDLKRIPDKLYKKIDTTIAKNSDLTTIVENAVVNAVNELPALKNNGKTTAIPAAEKKPRKRQPRKTKEVAAEPAVVNDKKKNGNGRKKKEAEPAATEA